MNNNFIYKISNTEKIGDVVVLNITPKEGSVFDFKPGQFVMIGIYDKDGNIWQRRPFSICSSPLNKKYLQLAIKVYGEFTQKIATLKKDDEVEISIPSGFFVFNENRMKETVFLAGGIGITPFISAIRYVSEKNLPNKIILLYSNKMKKDIIFFEELKSISQKHKNIQVFFILTNETPEHMKYESGRIDENMLKKYCSPFTEKYFSLCGPPMFMEAIITQLKKNEVQTDHIDTERFI